MFIDPNDPRLGNAADLVFRSFWPSSDAMLSGKVSALLSSTDGQASILQSAMASNFDALKIAVRSKATVLGDMLVSQMPQVASIVNGPYGSVVSGIFSSVEWGAVRKNPEQALTAMAKVGVPAALTALTSIPIAGQLAAAYFAVGLRLAKIASTPDPLTMPWSEYSRDSDEDLTSKVVLGVYSKSVDQTDLFRPPWDPSAPWRIGIAGTDDNRKGYVWSPWRNGAIPWRSNAVGAMPGTMRVFGQVQLGRRGQPPPAELQRYVRNAQGFTPKEVPLSWPGSVTNCGDYFPSTANVCGILGSMASNPGTPDSYKVDTSVLREEWSRAFEAMETSFADLWNKPGALIKDLAVPFTSLARRILSDAQSAWVAFRFNEGDPWSLGIPYDVPSLWGLVVPGVYKGGLPGDPAGRTPALWIEEDTPKVPGAHGWPYGKLPRQHHCARYKECSTDLAAVVDPEVIRAPVSANVSAGYRAMPWPPPEYDRALYASPWSAIIRPALDRQRAQQERALRTTLVCAYVRPVDTGGMPAYGAFRDPELRALCQSMREVLLTHPRRYQVNLKDVDAIDPAFAVRLRNSGVTGSLQDFQKGLTFGSAPLINDAPPPPDNVAPQGGLPFAAELGALLHNPMALKTIAAVIGGGALAGLGVIAWRRYKS